ncbi:MAG: orotate phosphoribosyltransferase [Microcoleus sp. PH2017_10_PVI_O_A]|uniref:orotate phosphoribosyltransferase n=1 Tax=unclassified Microcoleus TaxID=2642155 RepID=UPI001D3B810E|nr:MULTISPECIES: orotate phosphoribosyltransferase [unclassified Microcoleus]TAE75658.1 MAG: orotate phosphoribosyltransferase [Oscillatoriales cyanobacterium]MCC3409432.1 orotate phosphoribosyltransferase [Microcoleus sp. PH2017_10_PVI_O_A]MCC3463685.1 orotate phosphoribosyltransferase [Microcoleus sp. PH2017_11_PCY_U_A]MCC3482048.1 orotate phosphoribosyltransferase [Microcoleus sp. PH2017_12_PCY_D_A]MCC3531919.1 orotate phosphoribosyltransferase [Microcoleus sp. PH2017_21_RUC_O_A]
MDAADLNVLRDRLLDLLCEFAYREGDFVLSSGQKSSYYINCKPVTLHAEGALATGRVLLSMLPPQVQAVGGLTLGADPIVSAVSVVSALEGRSIPALIVRKETKGHGTMAYIEGPILPSGTNVAVLEDVVTTGKSAMQAVERLRGAGYIVDRVLSLIDREQGGAELYREQGLDFQAVFTIADLKEWISSKK